MFKVDKGKEGLGVQSQKFFYPQKLRSVNSFEQPNFCVLLSGAKNLDLLIFTGNLDNKL